MMPIDLEDLMVSQEDRAVIQAIQNKAIFRALAMSAIYIFSGVLFFAVYSAFLGRDVSFLVLWMVLTMVGYFEILPTLDYLKAPRISQAGYIWRMTTLGWEPVYRNTFGFVVCIGFKKGEDHVMWNHAAYVAANQKPE